MLHISEEQVQEVLTVPKAIELLENAFRRLHAGAAVNDPRRRIFLEGGTALHYMAAGEHSRGYLGAKLYSTNRRTGAHFLAVLFDASSGERLATIEADALGRIRTGAATGVATRHMAREDASAAAVIGCGHQAETQLEAVAAVRPLRRVKVYSRKPENREGFAQRMASRIEAAVTPAASCEEALREASIVVTITNSRTPVLDGAALAPGAHVNAAGSNHAKRRELGPDAVERAAVVAADSIEQAKIECGDLIGAAEEGRFDWERAVELSAIVAGETPGRRSASDITLFESQGLALEDIVTAGFVYEQFGRSSTG